MLIGSHYYEADVATIVVNDDASSCWCIKVIDCCVVNDNQTY